MIVISIPIIITTTVTIILSFNSSATENKDFVYTELMQRWTFQAVGNAFVSVDSFFALRLVGEMILNFISYIHNVLEQTNGQEEKFKKNLLLYWYLEVLVCLLIFISQFIRYARACHSHECFILEVVRFPNKLLG